MKLLFLTLIFLSVSVYSQNTPPEKDFQIWHETQIIVPLIKSEDKKNERVNLILYGTLRLGRNATRFVDERIGVGFEFKVNKYLTLSPSYIYRAAQPFAGRKDFENRLRFDVNLEKKFKYFTVKNRNRIEQNFRNSRSDQTRYRNRIQFVFPVKKANKELFSTFVSTEPFYEFQSKHWTRNEFSAGIIKKFNPNFTAEFFYMLQNNRGNSFKYVNVFGVNMKIKID